MVSCTVLAVSRTWQQTHAGAPCHGAGHQIEPGSTAQRPPQLSEISFVASAAPRRWCVPNCAAPCVRHCRRIGRRSDFVPLASWSGREVAEELSKRRRIETADEGVTAERVVLVLLFGVKQRQALPYTCLAASRPECGGTARRQSVFKLARRECLCAVQAHKHAAPKAASASTQPRATAEVRR